MKGPLRQYYLRLRKQAAQSELGRVSAAKDLARQIRPFMKKQSGYWASYRVMGSEIDPSFVEQQHNSILWVYPQVQGQNMRFFLKTTPPHAPSSFCAASKICGALVPLVAIDQRGVRLGRGGGHYDRWLGQVGPIIKVGVCFQVQVSEKPLPQESWDIAMDCLATEKEFSYLSQVEKENIK